MSERSADELLVEAEEAAEGRISVSQFVASLDWSLPGIGKRGGDYAQQVVGLVMDALDRLGGGDRELTPIGMRALAAAAALAAREGHQSATVAKAHALLMAGGLAEPGPAPLPVPRATVNVRARVSRPAPADETVLPADPALDPEIARMAAKLAPRRGAMRQLGLLGLGWAVALSLVLGVVAGIWLDGRFGTSPLLAVVGTLVGIASAVLTARQLIEQSRG